MKDWNRNLGRFKVDAFFFAGLNTDEGVNLFRDMVVLEVNFSWNSGAREYVALHRQFDVVPMGEVVPEYTAIFHRGTSTPTWVRKET